MTKPIPNADIPLPESISRELWVEFCKARAAKGRSYPFTTYAATLILNKLTALKAEGYDQNACLSQSIERGYSGVFQTKDKPPPAPINGKPQVVLLNNFLVDIAEHEAKLADPEVAARTKAARLAAMARLRPARTA